MNGRLAWLLCLCIGGLGASVAYAQAPMTGDAARGKEIYSRCLACHALAYDRTGPRHCGLFGRKAGSVKGFPYSQAMRDSHIVWDEKTLNWFLASPMTAVPGMAMGYAGIPDPQERADLIAYLKQENEGPDCAKKP